MKGKRKIMRLQENNRTNKLILTSWISVEGMNGNTHQLGMGQRFDLLKPVRKWLDNIEVNNRGLAHFIAKMIPAQCPFERDVKVLGKVIFHIPPMCKMNPLYEELVGLRFKALCYLADQCGEDISQYC